MRLGSHVAEDPVSSLATATKTFIENKRQLPVTSLVAEVWWHVLTGNFDQVVREGPDLHSRAAIRVAVCGADHDRGDISDETEQFESSFAPIILGRNCVVQHLGRQSKIRRHPCWKGVANIAFIVTEAARISELDQVIDENTTILTVVREDVKCMTELSR